MAVFSDFIAVVAVLSDFKAVVAVSEVVGLVITPVDSELMGVVVVVFASLWSKLAWVLVMLEISVA